MQDALRTSLLNIASIVLENDIFIYFNVFPPCHYDFPLEKRLGLIFEQT